jgi:hypothetical protein
MTDKKRKTFQLSNVKLSNIKLSNFKPRSDYKDITFLGIVEPLNH